jgi:transcriptional regulator with XRE-family HTH domain
MINVEIGRRLRNLREDRKLKQSDVALIMGKSQRTIGNYEAGDTNLDYEMVLRYAAYFDVTTDYIFGFNPETDKKITVPGLSETVVATVSKDFGEFTVEQIEIIKRLIEEDKASSQN